MVPYLLKKLVIEKTPLKKDSIMNERTVKVASLVLVFGCVFVTQSFAKSVSDVPISLSLEFDLFHESVSLNDMQLLSREEMKSTEGAINPLLVGAVVGASTAAGTYIYGARKGNYPYSTKGLIGNTTTGATIGALSGGAGAAAGGGFSVGANIWRFNGAAANFGANQVWRQNCGRSNFGPMCGR